jgi:hypothetical protein
MEDIDSLKQRIKDLEQENEELKTHLKKYTAPKRYKKYYENHKEELLTKMKEKPIASEKRKEYNKNYYLKKKMMKENVNKDIIHIIT